MKICSFLFLLTFSISLITAQIYQPMTENEATKYENLTVSYSAKKIKNRKTQDVYDIKMAIKNGGADLIKFKNNIGRLSMILQNTELQR